MKKASQRILVLTGILAMLVIGGCGSSTESDPALNVKTGDQPKPNTAATQQEAKL